MTNTSDADPEIERYKQRLLEERALSPEERIKRILARLHKLCHARGNQGGGRMIKSVLFLLLLFGFLGSSQAGPIVELYRYHADNKEFVFFAENKEDQTLDDNERVGKAMTARDAKSLLEIQVLADNWAARFYEIPVIVGSGLLEGSYIVPKSQITCVSKPMVHWLIDYPNAKGDEQTYHAVLLPNGTVVTPEVVELSQNANTH